ncbi:MAG: tRNA (adenosine(37)-N6)-threonylcarbamoyltransferase complex ATPase subunit type 1 TsaE [Deltaproteobacteria bacterium]|nr:tRNA (adenosine(37)-N6)-threonylcarbamoyltransferase complex ATPase subunit type 1 TsaE [Deltaproteobacteria bacterium]
MTRSFLISSGSVEETRRIGRLIGETADAGTIIALRGDLGSGKTALVQGLARGLKVPEKVYVTSPSYTLVNEYPGRLSLFHLDLYRLSDLDFEDIGLHDILDTHTAVVAIEWAERLGPDEFSKCLDLRMEITGENTRDIVFTANGDRYLQLLTRIEHRLKENLWH